MRSLSAIDAQNLKGQAWLDWLNRPYRDPRLKAATVVIRPVTDPELRRQMFNERVAVYQAIRKRILAGE